MVSEQVIDVFGAAGIKKPDVSILSEEFLLELQGMEHKNIALEVLKKLLSDELKSRTKKNLVKAKLLMEMLDNAIKKYHNKVLTATKVMDELIQLIISTTPGTENMPCDDTSDLIKIVLDKDERLTDYAFQKFSCGKVIGEKKLLGPQLFGKTAVAILEIELDEFEQGVDLADDMEHYLALKHLVALQKGLEVLFGRTAGGLDDICSLEYINHSPDGLEMVARLRPW